MSRIPAKDKLVADFEKEYLRLVVRGGNMSRRRPLNRPHDLVWLMDSTASAATIPQARWNDGTVPGGPMLRMYRVTTRPVWEVSGPGAWSTLSRVSTVLKSRAVARPGLRRRR